MPGDGFDAGEAATGDNYEELVTVARSAFEVDGFKHLNEMVADLDGVAYGSHGEGRRSILRMG